MGLHVAIMCREMDSNSNNIVLVVSAYVATPTMAQVPVMPINVPISVSPKKKPKKFNGLNFKRWQHKMLATPEPGSTRMVSLNRNPVDARLILFILQFISFSFSKVSQPESSV